MTGKIVYRVIGTVDANDIKMEDGGQALILEGSDGIETHGDGCLFIRLQSWDEKECKHPLMNELVGKKIRVTIEVED